MKHITSVLTILLLLGSCQSKKNAVIPPVKSHEYASATVYLTAKNTTDRLSCKGTVKLEPLPQSQEDMAVIMIDPAKSFQEIVGFGGAFTDAAAETFYKLPKDKQKEIITAYFDVDRGIGYTLGRTHINSCDFSSESYTYVTPGDTSLRSFSVGHDMTYRIPFIKEALAMVPDLRIFISPWSPPAWMKTNNDMLHGGKLKPEYMRSWARYYTRFISEYRKQGVPVWGLTVQNEPMATQRWESCIYTGDEEKNFVKNFLGPELVKAGMSDIKLMIWDHNRGIMFQRAQAVLDDPQAAQYVWGVAFHWYAGNHFENVRQVHDAYPAKHLFFTEGCTYPFDWKTIDEWQWGERYAHSMILDLNNWTCGWTDWNLILDEKGGPNHVGNYCFAPVIANTRTGSLHYMNSYWYIGHFSKFIRPGAKRIACSSSSDQLIASAFINPNGEIVVIGLNETEESMDTYIWIDGKTAKISMPGHSIITVLF